MKGAFLSFIRGLTAGLAPAILIASVSTVRIYAKPAELEGGRPDVYNKLAITAGNIVALRDINLQLQTRIEDGLLTPSELALFYSYPVHPVQAAGDFAKTPNVTPMDAIPVSPGVEAPPVTAPGDILRSIDLSLRNNNFIGYADLGSMAGDGTIGLTTTQGTKITYQLDNRFKSDPDVVLSPTTPVLTVGMEGGDQDVKQKGEAYLTSIRQYLLTSLPTNKPLAAILVALGIMIVGMLKAKGFQADYVVQDSNIPMMTNVRTVEVHEQQHVKDNKDILAGRMPIKSVYLDPKSAYYGVADSLMEVRAGLAENLSGGETNWPYLAINASNLRNALINTPGIPADLYAMALQDLQYAQYLLQENNGNLINF